MADKVVVANIIVQRRKKVREAFVNVVFRSYASNLRNERRFWLEPGRSKSFFWERTVSKWNDEDSDKLWLENFRMTKNTFLFICTKLRPEVERQDTRLRPCVPLEKRVAICIWHLATGEDLRSLGWRFSIAKSTACMITNEVCEAVVNTLMHLYIKWPTSQRLADTVNGFKERWDFPQCVGAIDATHIHIVAPSECSSDYYNRKSRYSIIMQAVVDHTYRCV